MAFTDSQQVLQEFQQWEIVQRNASLLAIPILKRQRLGKACPYLLQILQDRNSRRSLGIKNVCQLMVDHGYAAQSNSALAVRLRSKPPSSSGIAFALTGAVGLYCVFQLYKIAVSRRPTATARSRGSRRKVFRKHGFRKPFSKLIPYSWRRSPVPSGGDNILSEWDQRYLAAACY